MAEAPLIPKTQPTAPESALETQPDITLEDVAIYAASMSNVNNLEAHILKKLEKNSWTFKYPQETIATVLTYIQDGFLVGLSNGEVMVVTPPTVKVLDMGSSPILGLFAANNYFIAAASEFCCATYLFYKDNPLHILIDGCIVSLCGNMTKELLLLGTKKGAVLHFAIVDKENALFDQKTSFVPPEESSAGEIKTNDSTQWFAVRYESKSFGIWDHVNEVLLYFFTFNAGRGLPSRWNLGEITKLPEFFALRGKWAVFPEIIVFSSELVIKIFSNRITHIHHWSAHTDPDDNMWQAYGESLKRGGFPLIYKNSLFTFSNWGKGERSSLKKHYVEVEICLGFSFSMMERSAASYLAFTEDSALHVVCTAAIQSEFIHGLAGPLEITKKSLMMYSRLGELKNSEGKVLLNMTAAEKVLRTSRNHEWLLTGQIKERKTISFDLKQLNPPETRRISELFGLKELLHVRFTGDSRYLGLLLSAGLYVYDLYTHTITHTITRPKRPFVEGECWLKVSRSGLFIIVLDGSVMTLDSVSGKSDEFPFEYAHFCFVNQPTEDRANPMNQLKNSQIIAYSMRKTGLCHFGDFGRASQLSLGFDKVRVINSSRHCVGLNASGVYLLSISPLEVLIHIAQECQAVASKTLPRMFALSSNRESDTYGLVDVWDLELGFRTATIASGLKNVLGNKVSIRGPGWWRQPKVKLLERTDTTRACFKNTWLVDLEDMAKVTPVKKLDCLYLNEERLEEYCLLWKKFAGMLNTGQFEKDLAQVVIRPVNFNALHLLAHVGKATTMEQAAFCRCPIIKSVSGSPIAISLLRRSRKCVGIILRALILLRSESSSAFTTALLHISDDILPMISFGSPYLAEFMQQVIVPLPEEVWVPGSIKPNCSLPHLSLTDSLWVTPPEGPAGSSTEKEAVEYLICPFQVNMALGSSDSIKGMSFFVKNIEDNKLFSTSLIKTLVNMKWNWLWWYIVMSTTLYWVFLAVLIVRLFNNFLDQQVTYWSFIVLNSWFAAVELIQVCSGACEYLKDYWNYIDLLRIILSYDWIFSEFQGEYSTPSLLLQWKTFLVVLLSFLRGITTFQAFNATRYYVRMIIEVTRSTVSFIWVFFYSTFTFGILFAVVDPASFPDFFRIWAVAYEMNMGQFDSKKENHWYWFVFMAAALLNVVIMLNLVVSVLGNAFAKFQAQEEAADISGKAEEIYEIEKMMFWRRKSNLRMYLHICRTDDGEQAQDSERVLAIKKMLKQMQKKPTMRSMKMPGRRSKNDQLLAKLLDICTQLS